MNKQYTYSGSDDFSHVKIYIHGGGTSGFSGSGDVIIDNFMVEKI